MFQTTQIIEKNLSNFDFAEMQPLKNATFFRNCKKSWWTGI